MPTGSASVSSTGSAAAPPGSAAPKAVSDVPPADAAPPSTFVGAKSERACRAQTVELATYQTRGDLAIGAQGDAIAATWRVRLAGKPEQQIAFASFDQEGKPVAKLRAVGKTAHDATPRVYASGSDWVVVWFDGKGLAYARPRVDPLPPPEVAHVSAIGPEVAADVALAPWPAGGGVAATLFGADHGQLGLFVFAPAEGPAVKAMGVTHHAKSPKAPAIAASAAATFVAWDEDGALVASRFDAAGKESAACAIAPKGAEKRERLALAPTATGAIASWVEGGKVRTRALDGMACPASPIWVAAEGKWPAIAPLGDTALLAWVAADGHLLAVRLGADGAPGQRGIDASEGTAGVKDPPAVLAFGARAAFGWAEAMGPVISTKRLGVRIVDAACIP